MNFFLGFLLGALFMLLFAKLFCFARRKYPHLFKRTKKRAGSDWLHGQLWG